MKKFCSSCGNQLELSKRTCGECGAPNPFFIQNFTLLEDQSNELEKLRVEKEKIDRELSTKEAAQAEFQRQEQLRKELDELEKQKKETREKERLIREALEQGPEADLKQEILRVKKETEQYKKETIGLLQEMRDEFTQKIEEGNQKMKREIGGLAENKAAETPRISISPAPPEVIIPKRTSGNSVMVGMILVLAVLTTGIMAWFYLNQSHNPSPTSNVPQTVLPAETTRSEPIPTAADTSKNENHATSIADTSAQAPAPVNTALAEMPSPHVTKTVMIDSVKAAKPAGEWLMTESKVKNDLIGKRLSGCNIVIHNSAEISNVNHLTLIEKLPTGSLKYKFNLTVKQQNDVYTSIPYIYYTSDGHFVKVDGTNCE